MRANVYLITNMLDGNTYVGVTRFPISERWKQHKRIAGGSPKTYLHRAINKHGASNFKVEGIATCFDVSDAGFVERQVILSFMPTYNQTNGGEITYGKRVSRDVIEKIRASNTGKKRTSEQNELQRALAKERYAERPGFKEKIAAGLVSARANVNEEKRVQAVKSAQAKLRQSEEFRQKNTEQLNAARLRLTKEHFIKLAERAKEVNRKPVKCLSLNTTFNSVLEAADATGVYFSSISKACRGTRKSAGGMKFQFV